MAAKMALQDNAVEFFDQSLTRLLNNGKTNDNIVQRVRKTYEAFEDFGMLCMEADNRVGSDMLISYDQDHISLLNMFRSRKQTKLIVSGAEKRSGGGTPAPSRTNIGPEWTPPKG